ncbi:MAG: GIY-YIG nuclease family protein [Xanthobacteraceae bacterium]|nr:GIY-YIG nuclease family protein [Xanthobacteraceae bacterium]
MSAASYIYFIKPEGMTGPIKIGCSSVPLGRLSNLSTWSPFALEIVATVEGGQQLERNIHECFADLHSHREWFHAGPRLIEAIGKIKSGVPVERAINLSHRIGSIRKGRCGGANWDDQTRQKMSVLHRVRFALKRIGVDNGRIIPTTLKDVVRASEVRMLTADERAKLDAFIANPQQYEEELRPRYQEWKRQYDRLYSKQSPTPSHEGAAS